LSCLAGLALSGCAATPVPVATVPPGMQYLYGSGEAAALSRQAYAGLVAAVTAARGAPVSAVLAPGATLAAPDWVPCAGKPPAIVLDADETVLLNLGYEYADAQAARPYDPARWERWERTGARAVAAVPGAREALAAIRALGVTVIFNSNRNAATAGFTQAAIEGAGLGPAVHGRTLYLKGDAGGGSGKDARRGLIAARYCVVAMVGDQLGDFSDMFTGAPAVRRAAAGLPGIAPLWGRRWFVLPNPVYGTGLAGTIDDVFPTNGRWADPAATGERQ